jgi:hypothetical protein
MFGSPAGAKSAILYWICYILLSSAMHLQKTICFWYTPASPSQVLQHSRIHNDFAVPPPIHRKATKDPFLAMFARLFVNIHHRLRPRRGLGRCGAKKVGIPRGGSGIGFSHLFGAVPKNHISCLTDHTVLFCICYILRFPHWFIQKIGPAEQIYMLLIHTSQPQPCLAAKSALRATFVMVFYTFLVARPEQKVQFCIGFAIFCWFAMVYIKNRPCGAPCGAGRFFVF